MTRNLYSTIILGFICTLLLCFCFVVLSSAQENNDCKQRPVHVGLTYPLSTNGLEASQITNTFSLHALVGVSASEKAATISGIASIIKQDVQGLTLSGISNNIGGNARGLQIAGITNMVGGDAKGMQLAGIVNMSRSTTGMQLTGIANITKDADGAQVSGFVNVAKEAEVQLAGFANTARESGSQIAGFVNTSKDVKGIQVAGFVNTAREVEHQVAGFINIAQKVMGVQVAGFINVADECDYPIGFINIIKNGEKQLGLSIDENGSTLINFRSGGRVLYGILGAGYNVRFPEARYVLEAGIGSHMPVSKSFRVNMELVSTVMSDIRYNAYFRSSARILAEVKFANCVGLFAGPSINYLGYERGQSDLRNDQYIWRERYAYHYNGIYIGGVAGIHFNL